MSLKKVENKTFAIMPLKEKYQLLLK